MRHFLIPARGGSKGVPGKALVDVGGKPLIAWTIEAALACVTPEDKVVVNSDADDILVAAADLGAETFKRSDDLATDVATMKDVVDDYLRHHFNAITERCDTIVLLYPTCPFRDASWILRAIRMYEKRSSKSLMSVVPSRSRPDGGIEIRDRRVRAISPNAGTYYRRQDTPTTYYATGAIFIFNHKELKNLNTQLFNSETAAFKMEGLPALDIDTPDDLFLAQAVAEKALKAPGDSWQQAPPPPPPPPPPNPSVVEVNA